MSEIINYLKDKGLHPERSGNIYRLKCPFPDHRDLDPSFMIYPLTETCFCWGCKKWADINTLRELFGDPVQIKIRYDKTKTNTELLKLLNEKKKDIYSIIVKFRNLRKTYKDTKTLNKRLMRVLDYYHAIDSHCRFSHQTKTR